MAVWLQVKVRKHGLSLWQCTPTVCNTEALLQLWLVVLRKCYMPLPMPMPLVVYHSYFLLFKINTKIRWGDIQFYNKLLHVKDDK